METTITISKTEFTNKAAAACAEVFTDYQEKTGDTPPITFLLMLPLVCAAIQRKLFHEEEEEHADAAD